MISPEDGTAADVSRLESQLLMQRQILLAQRAQIHLLEQQISALEGESESLREFIDALPGFGFVKDSNLKYVRANRAFCDLLKIPYDEIEGKSDFDIFPADLARKYIDDDRTVIESGHPIVVEEITYNAETGDRFVVETRKHPWFDKNGQVIGVYGMGIDISGQKEAEEERSQLEFQLQQKQKLASIGSLAGGVAHDFNNMLTVILFAANSLMEQITKDHPFYEEVNEILKAGTRSAELTRQLLAFSRKQAIVPREINLNETVAGMLKMIRRLLGESIELVWEPSDNPWPIWMDPSQIDQIIANLAINGRDAISGGGTIRLGTSNCKLSVGDSVLEDGYVPGDYICLTVSDDGVGMEPEMLAHIFEPFFTTKTSREGMGLGLLIVHGAVLQNHGFVRVDSVPGCGTTFSLYLPRYQGVQPVVVKKGGISTIWSNTTVLLVEDEPSVLRTTTNMLSKIGCTVLAARTADEALSYAKLNSGNIDLLITDVIMPGGDGVELARSLEAYIPNLKVLFMSGYTADIIRAHGGLDDGVHSIAKPFSKQDLALKLSEILH